MGTKFWRFQLNHGGLTEGILRILFLWGDWDILGTLYFKENKVKGAFLRSSIHSFVSFIRKCYFFLNLEHRMPSQESAVLQKISLSLT